MIRDLDDAQASLADALWWLKGFAAAQPPEPFGEGGGSEVHMLAIKLREVRIWLERVREGRVRRIGEEQVVVLTYAEFERLVDASEPNPRLVNIQKAQRTIRDVLEAYNREALEARSPEAPF